MKKLVRIKLHKKYAEKLIFLDHIQRGNADSCFYNNIPFLDGTAQ